MQAKSQMQIPLFKYCDWQIKQIYHAGFRIDICNWFSLTVDFLSRPGPRVWNNPGDRICRLPYRKWVANRIDLVPTSNHQHNNSCRKVGRTCAEDNASLEPVPSSLEASIYRRLSAVALTYSTRQGRYRWSSSIFQAMGYKVCRSLSLLLILRYPSSGRDRTCEGEVHKSSAEFQTGTLPGQHVWLRGRNCSTR